MLKKYFEFEFEFDFNQSCAIFNCVIFPLAANDLAPDIKALSIRRGVQLNFLVGHRHNLTSQAGQMNNCVHLRQILH